MTISSVDQASSAFEELMRARKSVRAYTDEAASEAVLKKVFSTAQLAPSNCNTQPWLAHVVSGEKLDRLRKLMRANTVENKFTMDFPYEGKYAGVYQERQYGSANALYSSMKVERADKAARQELFLRNYECFGAPHVVFLFMPKPFSIRESADVGLYAQSLMLSMVANGLACCPQTSLGFHADLVREELGIDDSQQLLFGISFGFEDTEHPINTARTDRAELVDSTTFHS